MDAIFEQWTIRYLKRKLSQLIKVNKKNFLLNLKLLIDTIFGQINLEFNGKRVKQDGYLRRVVCISNQIMVTRYEKNSSKRLSKVYCKTVVNTHFSDTFFLQAQFMYYIFILFF